MPPWRLPSGRYKALALPALFCFVLLPSYAKAAAWLLPEQKWQVIQNVTYYQTESYYDPMRERRPAARFTKLEYQPYAEYGLKDHTTLGFSFTAQHLSETTVAGAKTRNQGVNELQLYSRHLLNQNKNAVLSVQPMVILPGAYNRGGRPSLGNNAMEAEIRLLYGHRFSLLGQNHFLNLEAAYRKRMERPADQVRLDATLGVRPQPHWLFLMQHYGTLATRGPMMGTPARLVNAEDYSLSKLQLSAVYQMDERWQLQVGWFRHLLVENSGGGGGVMVSVWSDF